MDKGPKSCFTQIAKVLKPALAYSLIYLSKTSLPLVSKGITLPFLSKVYLAPDNK